MVSWIAVLCFALGVCLGYFIKPKKRTRKKKPTIQKILNPVPKGTKFMTVKSSKRKPIVRSEEEEWAKEHEL